MKAIRATVGLMSHEQAHIVLALMTLDGGIDLGALAELTSIQDTKLRNELRQLVEAGIVLAGAGMYQFNIACDHVDKAKEVFGVGGTKRRIVGSTRERLYTLAPSKVAATELVDEILGLAKMKDIVDGEMGNWRDALEEAQKIAVMILEKNLTFEQVRVRYQEDNPNLYVAGGSSALPRIAIAASVLSERKLTDPNINVVSAESISVPNFWET